MCIRDSLQSIGHAADGNGTVLVVDLIQQQPVLHTERRIAHNGCLLYTSSVSQENGWPAVGEVVLGGGSDAGYIAEMGVPILCSCGVRGERCV